MPRRWSLALVLATVVAGPLAAVTPAAAETEVEIHRDVVTITVPIDCAGCKGKTVTVPNGKGGTKTEDLVDYWERVARDAWQQAFDKYPYCSKYRFELKVKIHAKGEAFGGKDGHHRVQVSTGNPNGKLVPPPGFEPHGTSAYGQDFDGLWDEQLPAAGVAHEVGHLLGLADDYVVVTEGPPRVTKPKPGREHTMMADGGAVDRALVDRIGKALEAAGKLPKCKNTSYQGTLHMESTGSHCTSSYDGQLALEVTPDDDISGSATASGSYTCSGITISDGGGVGVTGIRKGKALRLTGTTSGQTLGLATACLLAGQAVIKVRGDDATADYTYVAQSGDRYHCTIDLARADRQPSEPNV